MPITTMDASDGSCLGFSVSGDVTKADYEVLAPAVGAAVDQYGSIELLIDLSDFHTEKANAWGADLHFGHEYHHKINRLAIVGNKTWQKHLAGLASPFYAKDSKFFENTDDAWAWLKG